MFVPCVERLYWGLYRGRRAPRCPQLRAPAGGASAFWQSVRCAIGLTLVLASSSGCTAPHTQGVSLSRFEREEPCMGTLFRIVAYASEARQAEAALAAAFDAVREVERWASDWDPDSEVRRVAALAETLPPQHPVPVSAALAEHTAFALAIAERTGGAFDPTLGTLTRLWRRSARLGELPSPERLAEARARAGYAALAVDSAGALRFAVPGLRLDFGGSAKGEALDRALAALAVHGLERALVDGGGDLRAGAPPPGAAAWRVAVRPFGPAGRVLALDLVHGALATSGDFERAFELDGVTYGHVLDPATGLGLSARRAASVLAPDGRTADALATAVLVAGDLAVVAGFPGCAAALFEPESPDFPACATAGFPQDGGATRAPRGPNAR